MQSQTPTHNKTTSNRLATSSVHNLPTSEPSRSCRFQTTPTTASSGPPYKASQAHDTPVYRQATSDKACTETAAVLAPMFQAPKGTQNASLPSSVQFGDRPTTFNPEQFNPDGSLHTVHTLPNFDLSYTQALHTRYIRHRGGADMEKLLTTSEIFDKEDHH